MASNELLLLRTVQQSFLSTCSSKLKELDAHIIPAHCVCLPLDTCPKLHLSFYSF